jgi:hypothetical protein
MIATNGWGIGLTPEKTRRGIETAEATIYSDPYFGSLQIVL